MSPSVLTSVEEGKECQDEERSLLAGELVHHSSERWSHWDHRDNSGTHRWGLTHINYFLLSTTHTAFHLTETDSYLEQKRTRGGDYCRDFFPKPLFLFPRWCLTLLIHLVSLSMKMLFNRCYNIIIITQWNGPKFTFSWWLNVPATPLCVTRNLWSS